MCYASFRAGVEDFIDVFQAGHHIVGIEDGIFRSIGQSLGSQHFDISVGNGQEERVTIGSCRNGIAFVTADFNKGMRGKEVEQFF
jgi:hypothetical protein